MHGASVFDPYPNTKKYTNKIEMFVPLVVIRLYLLSFFLPNIFEAKSAKSKGTSEICTIVKIRAIADIYL